MDRGRVQGKISNDFGSLDLILSVNKCGVTEMILESYKPVFNFWLLYLLAVRLWANDGTILNPNFLLCVKKTKESLPYRDTVRCNEIMHVEFWHLIRSE